MTQLLNNDTIKLWPETHARTGSPRVATTLSAKPSTKLPARIVASQQELGRKTADSRTIRYGHVIMTYRSRRTQSYNRVRSD